MSTVEYMFRNFPQLWLVVAVYLVAAAGILWHLFTRRDCLTCSHKVGLLRSGLLAAVVTPSIITDFFVAAIYTPALIGFLFVVPAIPFNDQLVQLLRFALLFYVLPWMICTGVIYGVWTILRRGRPIEQP